MGVTIKALIAVEVIDVINIKFGEPQTIEVIPLITAFTLDHRLGGFALAVTEGLFLWV